VPLKQAHGPRDDKSMSNQQKLQQAAAAGDQAEVERLLGLFSEPPAETNRWASALFEACNAGHIELVRLLLGRTRPSAELLASLAAQLLIKGEETLALELIDGGASPDEAVREAAELGLGVTVKRLLGSGRVGDEALQDAWFVAAREGKPAALSAFLESPNAAALLPANDHAGFGAWALAAANGHSEAALLLAARSATARGLVWAAAQRGDAALLERAIGLGEDPKRLSDEGQSALHYAASAGHKALVARLLELGCDLEGETQHGGTPASMAAREGHLELVLELERRGASLGRALVEAAAGGQLAVVEHCLAQGASVESVDEYSETALHKAAEHGDVAILRALLAKQPKLDRVNINGWTALMRAAGHGSVEAVQLLIDQRAAVNFATEYGYETALAWAVKRGHLAVVDLLLRSGAIIMRKGYNRPLFLAAAEGYSEVAMRLCQAGAVVDEEDDGKTPLQQAARAGHLATAQLLLERGAKASEQALLSAAEGGHVELVTLLRAHGAVLPAGFLSKAAEGRQAGLVKLALEAGQAVDERAGYWARTPLMVAADRGALDVVELLLQAGADPNLSDSERKTSVRLAQQGGHREVVAALVAGGARPELVALGELAASGNVAELSRLLAANAHPDVRLELERTPLHEAAALGQLEAVQALIAAGAAVDLVDADGWTALMEACDFGQLELVRALLAAKADPFLLDRASFSAFRLAERAGHAPVVALFRELELDRDWRPDLFAAARAGDLATLQRLAKKGRPLDLLDYGSSIVHLAAESGHLEALRFALEHGLAQDAENRSGATPLYLAASGGHEAVVELLLARGARYDVCDRYGESAVSCAAARGHLGVLKRLLAAGADCERTDSEGATALSKALNYGQNAAALLLLEAGAKAGPDALRQAIGKDDAIVKVLLARGYKLPGMDRDARALAVKLWEAGETAEVDDLERALVEAVESDEAAVVKAFLQRGVSANARNSYGQVALLIARTRGDKAIEKLLTQHGGKPLGSLCAQASAGNALKPKELNAALADGDSLDATDREGNTALHIYAESGDEKSVKLLLEAGAPINALNGAQETPLLLALQKEHYELAALLEQKGADVSAGDPELWSAAAHYLGHGLLDRARAAVAKGASPRWLVHAAAGSGEPSRLDLALELGGLASAVTKSGWTAARYAAGSGKRELLDRVVELGSPPDFALHGAVSAQDAELVRYVLERFKPDLNAKDGWHRTALHEAMFGEVEIATLLLDAGADPNIPNDDGATAIFFAADYDKAELIRLLLSRDARIDHKNTLGQTVSDRARWGSAELKSALGIAESTNRWGY
jgi:ankyrin repeat protein